MTGLAPRPFIGDPNSLAPRERCASFANQQNAPILRNVILPQSAVSLAALVNPTRLAYRSPDATP